ncbi:MAG: STAS domain-containing protein [Cellvibrionaceae bacterium]
MSDVSSGNILVADHNGVYVIKMSGDVRLTLCVSFDECIEELTARDGFYTVLFDLSEAEGLDSTTLGLIAKLAMKSYAQNQKKPLVICSDAGIERLIMTMGLDDVCELIDKPPQDYCEVTDFISLDKVDESHDEEQIKAKILESHCVLMELNESNRETFKDLVQTLRCG